VPINAMSAKNPLAARSSWSVKCNACLRESDDDAVAALWDGKAYCRQCLEAGCPGLFEFARLHPQLEETAPYEPVRIAKHHAVFYLGLGLILGLAMAAAAFQSEGVFGLFVGILGGLMIGLLAGLIQIPPYLWMTRRMLPTVRFEGGQVFVGRGLKTTTQRHSYTLDSLRWYCGKVRQDSQLRMTFILNGPAVILELPGRRERVACGWTAERRQRLTAFLRLAGVPSSDSS